MITAIIIGKEGVVTTFRQLPLKASDALYRTLTRLAIQLTRHIKEDKLSGQVLRNRTGTLRRSINYRVVGTSTLITAFVGTNLDYARIHEYGGTTKPHVIEPKNAQALHFLMNGKDCFFKRVNHPGSRMPERSFLRSALTDLREEFIQEITGTMRKVVKHDQP
jgi:phage gpG-like protein